jgi:NADH dehydrogenase/NADH:ubiquinone oxidoreductase subunit G
MSALPTTIAYLNGRPVNYELGETILQFSRRHLGKDSVPTLCDAPNLEAFGACRVCSVEVALAADGPRRVKAACHTQVEPGMHIFTETPDIQRLNIIELVLTDHPLDCLTCEVNGNCELQDVAAQCRHPQSALPGRQKPPRPQKRPQPPVHDLRYVEVHYVLPLRARLRRGAGPIGAQRGRSRLRQHDHQRHEPVVF